MKTISYFMKRHTFAACILLGILLILSAVVCVGIGPVRIPFKTVWQIMLYQLFGAGDISSISENTKNIVWFLRAPRVLLGILVSISLTLSGVAMQAFTKNPLASPYVLGISAGASLGAVLGMATGLFAIFGSRSVQAGAFAGSLLSIFIVYTFAKSGNEVAPIKLILVGMAVSAMFTAFSNYIVYKTPDDRQVRNITFWMLGSIASADWPDLVPLVLVLPPSILALYAMSGGLNALMMGESSAVTLGVNVRFVRKLTIIISAVMTGTAVSMAGSIGFVGLVVPHVVRSVVGADHRRVIPLSVFVGAIFLIWVDVAARMLDAPGEIPIGIITSMLGAPFFLWMIRVRKYSFGGEG